MRHMSTAQRLLIGYGTLVLVVGFALGTVLGSLRMRGPAIRTLTAAHVETLLQGAMHFGLAFAVGAVGFGSAWATWGAVLIVVGSAMQATGVTMNWVTATPDQFASRSPGFVLNSLSTFVIWPGLAVTAVGILTRL
jgi:hypothetical protein